jgi:hypothetical protein
MQTYCHSKDYFNFQLFTGVVVFGMFHGLVFLPIALSWFGPPARRVTEKKTIVHNIVAVDCRNGYYQINKTIKEGMWDIG